MPTHSKGYYFGQYSQFLGHSALGKGLDLEDMASGLCPEKIAFNAKVGHSRPRSARDGDRAEHPLNQQSCPARKAT